MFYFSEWLPLLVHDHPAPVAEMVVLVVNDPELAGGDALYLLVGLDPVEVADAPQVSMREFRRVAYLESDFFRVVERSPWILGDEIETVHVDGLAILRLGIVAVGDVDDVTPDVFLDDEPRAAAQSQSFPLADGVEPIAVVLAQHFAGLQLHDLARPASEVTLDEIVVVDFSQETDALAVLAPRAGQPLRLGDGAYLAFHQVADGEHQFAYLQVGDLPEEIGLILYRVLGGGKPGLPVDFRGCGIVSRGDFIEILPPFLLETSELDVFVAHHIRIRGEPALHGVDRVADHLVPILVVEGDDLEPAPVFTRDIRGDLDILLGGAIDVAVLVFHPDADVKDRGIVSRLLELIDDDGAIHSS